MSGYEANSGTGTPVTPKATLSGFGAVVSSGAGTPSISPVTMSGLGAVTHTGTGAMTVPLPTLWGIYDKSDMVVPMPTMSGAGSVTNQEIGNWIIPSATMSGTGSHSLVTTDPDDGSLDGLNRDIASYSWKSINPKGNPELRRALYRLDLSNQQIVQNINNDITNIIDGTTNVYAKWKPYIGPIILFMWNSYFLCHLSI
jgi:hypothetical protein